MGGVTVQIQWIQDIFHHVCLLVLQNVVSENPWEGHLNGKLEEREEEEEEEEERGRRRNRSQQEVEE